MYLKIIVSTIFLYFICCLKVFATVTVETSIEGAEGEQLTNIKGYLSIEQQKKHPKLTNVRVEILHSEAKQEIREALQPFGFYQTSIESSLKIKKEDDNDTIWEAKYVIKKNKPIPIKEINLKLLGDGEHDKVLKKVFSKFPLKIDQTINHKAYESFKRQLLTLLTERGYFDGEFTQHLILIDLNQYIAKITLTLDTKTRYKFGDVRFESKEYAHSFLKRFRPYERGDYYNSNKLLNYQNVLSNNNYFRLIEVVPDINNTKDDRVDVDVKVTPAKKYNFTTGAGFGTDTGFRGKFSWDIRRVNKYGHRFSNLYQISQYINNTELRYLIPGAHPATDLFIFNAGYVEDHAPERDLDTRTYIIGAQFIQNDPVETWARTWALNYQSETFNDPESPGNETAKILLPSIALERIKSNDRFITTKGYRIRLETRGTSDLFLSSTSFLQGKVSAKYIHSIFERDRILTRGTIGVSEHSKADEIPPSLRFFTGGDNTVRGYGYQSLGPTQIDSRGNDIVVGGRYLLEGSFEYERHLYKNYFAAFFYDTGNAMNNFNKSLKRSAGIGVRWHSPIGPVKIDIAYPFDSTDTPANLPIRLHLNIGPDL